MRFGLNVMDEKGIRKIWHTKPKMLWQDVVYIETVPINGYFKGYKTILYSDKAKFSFSFRIASVNKEGQTREIHEHCLFLKKLLEHCSEILIDHRTEFIFKWSDHLPRFAELGATYGQQKDDLSAAYELACLNILLLDHRHAKRILKNIIKKDPQHVKALTLLFSIETKYIYNTKAVNDLLKLDPKNADLLTRVIFLVPFSARQQSHIDRLFKMRKGNFQVRLKLIDEYLWKKEYDIAKKHISALRQEYEKTAYKDAIDRIINYTIKYRTDIDFRNKVDGHADVKITLFGVIYAAVMAFLIFYVFKQNKILLLYAIFCLTSFVLMVLLFSAVRLRYI